MRHATMIIFPIYILQARHIPFYPGITRLSISRLINPSHLCIVAGKTNTIRTPGKSDHRILKTKLQWKTILPNWKSC